MIKSTQTSFKRMVISKGSDAASHYDPFKAALLGTNLCVGGCGLGYVSFTKGILLWWVCFARHHMKHGRLPILLNCIETSSLSLGHKTLVSAHISHHLSLSFMINKIWNDSYCSCLLILSFPLELPK